MICAPQQLPVFGSIDAFVVIFFTIDFGARLIMISFMPAR
jgi:hypothetical protein